MAVSLENGQFPFGKVAGFKEKTTSQNAEKMAGFSFRDAKESPLLRKMLAMGLSQICKQVGVMSRWEKKTYYDSGPGKLFFAKYSITKSFCAFA